MSFDFFNISKDFLKEYKGIAGSKYKATLELCTLTYEEGNPRPIETTTTIEGVECLVTDITKTQLKYQSWALVEGRRNVNVRIQNKQSILNKLNVSTFDALKNNKSYVIFNNQRYNITGWQDFINADFIHFYCASVDD